MTPVMSNGTLPGEEGDSVPGPLGQAATAVLPPLGPRGGDLSKNPNLAGQMADLNIASGTLHKGPKKYTPSTVVGLSDEKPWHTMAAYMLIAGRTDSEIALAAQVSIESIKGLRAQNWFQQRLSLIANDDGQELLGSMKSHALACIERVAAMAESAESERNKLSANIFLIEQTVGKAVQKNLNINASTNSGLSPQEDYDRTQEELRMLRAARQAPLEGSLRSSLEGSLSLEGKTEATT